MEKRVLDWLGEEAKNINKEISKVDKKMSKLVEKNGFDNFDKLTKLNQEKIILQAQENKLYELIGKFSLKLR